jgi:predicted MFS family arabinose efflux permease
MHRTTYSSIRRKHASRLVTVQRQIVQSSPVIALGLALCPAIAVGLARFAYALLLPVMRADLGWSYALAGGMNTANAAGYLIGAVVAARLSSRLGSHRCFIGGLVVTACRSWGRG